MFTIKYFKHLILDWVRYTKNLYTNERVKFNVERFKKSKTKKDKVIIRAEMRALRQFWGDIPLQYITHDFYDQNCKLTLEEMKEYIPGYYFYHVIYPQYDNIKKASKFVEDKIKAYYLFKELGYRVIEPLFVRNRGCYDPVSSKEFDDSMLTIWLNKINTNKVFIKPIGGRGGKGIIVAKRINSNFFFENSTLDLAFLKKLDGDFIVEPGIIQSDYVSLVYSNSVNTLRVITKRDGPEHQVSIIAITLRMGCSGREVDNSSQGGLLMGIDIKSGKSLKGYAVYEYGSERFYEHPDTGYKFSEFYVRNWEDFHNNLLEIANKMKVINLAGWDIAITDDGPLVIETNIQFGLDHTQSGVGGLSKFFIKSSPLEFLQK